VILKTNDVILGENSSDKSLEGDKKNPSGIYYIKNFIPDKKLPVTHGYGAFPLNYPKQIESRGKLVQGYGYPGDKRAIKNIQKGVLY